MGKLFGTDGIRGVANEYPMTPEMALKVGQAVGLQFRRHQRICRIDRAGHPNIGADD